MYAITLFAWLGSHSQTRSTLVVVPYLVIEMSRHAHHSSSSLHLHGCKCMDAGIKPTVFSCRVRRQLTRTDMMVDVAAAQFCVTCTSKVIIVLTLLFHSSPPTCFFRGIAYLVSTAHAASISLTGIKYVVCRVQGGCDVIAYSNSSGTARNPANLSSARLCC
jgi:hypothetical protein